MARARRSLPLVALAAALLASSGASADPSSLGTFVPVTHGLGHDTLSFRLLAYQEARKAGLPYDLVDAVMQIESGYRPEMIGGVGEIGLMQVRPTTAAMLGYRGDSVKLAEPAVNIHYGTTYLGQAWQLAHGDVCRTLMKYRAGHGEETMSALSVTYCSRARDHLAAIGSPLAALIKPDDLVPAMASLAVKPAGRLPRGGPAFWSAFKAKIAVANARVEAKWRRMAAR